MGKNPLFMLILSIIISLPLNVVAVEPSEILQNPQLETRARSLSQNIRCLVCQNQSIDDSNASLAKDLRKIVREQLVSGASDDEIYNFLIERYGDFVLLRPPVKATTYILYKPRRNACTSSRQSKPADFRVGIERFQNLCQDSTI